MPTPIRVVLFDIGGVLLRLRPWPEACAFAEDQAGMCRGKTKALTAIETNPDSDAAHLDYERGNAGTATFTQKVGEIFGVHPSAVASVFCARIEGAYAGTTELLDRLDAAGIQTGCLSNTNALHWALMLGVFGDQAPARIPVERLRHRVTSHTLGLRKPETGIYASAETILGLQGPQIAFFDDNQANVEGALARGWQAHRIDPHAAEIPAQQITAHLTRMKVLP